MILKSRQKRKSSINFWDKKPLVPTLKYILFHTLPRNTLKNVINTSSFFNPVAGLWLFKRNSSTGRDIHNILYTEAVARRCSPQPATLLKKRLQQRCLLIYIKQYPYHLLIILPQHH